MDRLGRAGAEDTMSRVVNYCHLSYIFALSFFPRDNETNLHVTLDTSCAPLCATPFIIHRTIEAEREGAHVFGPSCAFSR